MRPRPSLAARAAALRADVAAHKAAIRRHREQLRTAAAALRTLEAEARSLGLAPDVLDGDGAPGSKGVRPVAREARGGHDRSEPGHAPSFDRLRQLTQESTDISVRDHRNAEILFRQLRKAPAESRRQMVLDRVQAGMTDGEADELMDLLQQNAEGISPLERVLSRSPIQARAKFVLESLQKLEGTQRRDLFLDWVQKGIITDRVADEISGLISPQPE